MGQLIEVIYLLHLNGESESHFMDRGTCKLVRLN